MIFAKIKASIRGLLALIMMAMPLATVLAGSLPAPSASAQAPSGSALCYNMLAGSLPIVCLVPAQDTVIQGKTVAQGGKFEPGKCYTFADVSKGWEEDDCQNDIFKQAMRGTNPICTTRDPSRPDCTVIEEECDGTGCDVVAKILNPVINFLAAAVGIVVTIAIVIGGIQYSSSGDDPSKVAAAKSRIINALLGLLGFMFVWAFLQWFIPGGVW